LAEVFRAAMQALNVIYGVEERRGRLRRLVTSLGVSVLTITLFVAALVLMVAGARISAAVTEWTGMSVSYQLLWTAAAWVVIVLTVTAGFALTYYFAPDVEQRLRWVSGGSIVGVAAWLLFTGLFAIYVNVLSSPSETYGSLAGIAFFMVYVYGASFILLLGAVINQVIEQSAPEGKNEGERQPRE
jgi:membrane protein